jgi:hypothetical protein
MSPAGIPMFYGALDAETAIRETYTTPEKPATASVAVFELLKPMSVLDLTKLGEVPSLFDEQHRHERESIKFLEAFIAMSQNQWKRRPRTYEYVLRRYSPNMFATYLRRPKRFYNGDSLPKCCA